MHENGGPKFLPIDSNHSSVCASMRKTVLLFPFVLLVLVLPWSNRWKEESGVLFRVVVVVVEVGLVTVPSFTTPLFKAALRRGALLVKKKKAKLPAVLAPPRDDETPPCVRPASSSWARSLSLSLSSEEDTTKNNGEIYPTIQSLFES